MDGARLRNFDPNPEIKQENLSGLYSEREELQRTIVLRLRSRDRAGGSSTQYALNLSAPGLFYISPYSHTQAVCTLHDFQFESGAQAAFPAGVKAIYFLWDVGSINQVQSWQPGQTLSQLATSQILAKIPKDKSENYFLDSEPINVFGGNPMRTVNFRVTDQNGTDLGTLMNPVLLEHEFSVKVKFLS